MGTDIYNSLLMYKAILKNLQMADGFPNNSWYSGYQLSKPVNDFAFNHLTTDKDMSGGTTENRPEIKKSTLVDLTVEDTAAEMEPLDLSMQCRTIAPSAAKEKFENQPDDAPLDLRVKMENMQTNVQTDQNTKMFLVNLGLQRINSSNSTASHHLNSKPKGMCEKY